MERADYLDRLLAKYAGTFDIYKPYSVKDKEYPAYGYFFSCNEKYVLMKKATLWAVHAYEHILFMDVEDITSETIKEAQDLVENHLEPLVRKGNKYPEKDHMYSYLTVVIVAQHEPSKEVKKLISKFKFDKGYMFSLRGYSEGHLICAVMDSEKVYTNSRAKALVDTYKKTFDEVRKGAIGYSEAFEEDEQKVL